MHQRGKPESKDLGFAFLILCLYLTKQVSGHDFSRAESRPKKEARDRAQAKERAPFADAQKIDRLSPCLRGEIHVIGGACNCLRLTISALCR